MSVASAMAFAVRFFLFQMFFKLCCKIKLYKINNFIVPFYL